MLIYILDIDIIASHFFMHNTIIKFGIFFWYEIYIYIAPKFLLNSNTKYIKLFIIQYK